MYKVGDKVKIKRTNTVHEIESIISFDSGYVTKTKIKLKGLIFEFGFGEITDDLDMEHFRLIGVGFESGTNELDLELVMPNKPIQYKVKTVRANEFLRIGDRMKVKGSDIIYEIEAIYKDNYFELLGRDGIYHISELEIVIPNKPVRYEPKTNDKHHPPLKSYKQNYISINGFKKGDIVEKDGLLFEIVELNAAMPFKLKPISEGFYVEFDPNELKPAKAQEPTKSDLEVLYNELKERKKYLDSAVILEEYNVFAVKGMQKENTLISVRVGEMLLKNIKIKPVTPKEPDFIATWQKEREFYLIESKCGSLSRMDKPEFEEYCEKMDKLNVKYKVIE